MKKRIRFHFLIFLLVIILFGFNQCDWGYNPDDYYYFKPFITDTYVYDLKINVISDTTQMVEIATFKSAINLDSLIKVKDIRYSYLSVRSIELTECKLTVLNPDSNNNLSNFINYKLNFYSNTKTDSILLVNKTNPDTYSDTISFPTYRRISLNYYFEGNQQYYIISAKARRPTTKQINCKISFKFKVG